MPIASAKGVDVGEPAVTGRVGLGVQVGPKVGAWAKAGLEIALDKVMIIKIDKTENSFFILRSNGNTLVPENKGRCRPQLVKSELGRKFLIARFFHP